MGKDASKWHGWTRWITLAVAFVVFMICQGYADSSEQWMAALETTRLLVGSIVAIIGMGAILGGALTAAHQWHSSMVPWVVVLLAGMAVASAHWAMTIALGPVVLCTMIPAAAGKATGTAPRRKAA